MKSFLPILLLAWILSACAPAANTSVPAATVPAASATPAPAPAITAEAGAAPAETAPAPQPQATSRGDNLVASDPASVNLTSGKPALVEFFRFT